MKALIVLVLALMAAPAMASDKDALIAQIVAGGQNEWEDERHAVEVNNCQLTTYRWKNVENEGWVLWTSFEFPMMLVDLSENTTTPEIDYYIPVKDEPPLAIILFKAKEGADFTHEKPFHRPPKGDITKSSRGDGTTHYFERKASGMILQQGPDVEAKAKMFTEGYLRYRQEYCAFIG